MKQKNYTPDSLLCRTNFSVLLTRYNLGNFHSGLFNLPDRHAYRFEILYTYAAGKAKLS